MFSLSHDTPRAFSSAACAHAVFDGRLLGAPVQFQSIVYPDTGHIYTPGMRREMLAWFERWLKADKK